MIKVANPDNPVSGILMFAFGLGMLIELGFRRGTVGPNLHGSDPLEGAEMAREPGAPSPAS
jgi:hypothetical protein